MYWKNQRGWFLFPEIPARVRRSTRHPRWGSQPEHYLSRFLLRQEH
jgi:hypothetical protein